MRQRKTAVTVRLDADELAALRQQPGDNDADRLRGMIRAAGLVDSIVERIDASLDEIIAGAVQHIDKKIADADTGQRQRQAAVLEVLKKALGGNSA